jgi:hypothetical protein
MLAQSLQSEYSSSLLCSSIRIGDISLSFKDSFEDIQLGSGLSAFSGSAWEPNIEVAVEWRERLRSLKSSPVFDSGAVWSLFCQGSDFVFDFSSSVISPHPYKRLLVNEDFNRARLLLSREALDSFRPIFPLEYPADELLITNYLAAHGLGVEVHGCGLIDSESGGHLFLGHSGSGKSTTARLWQSLHDPEILSDDRIILRFENGELWMHGTPWHGEGQFASPGKARITSIHMLQHGLRNRFSDLRPSLAAGELFARSFPPFHSAEGLQRTIEFLERVASVVPCYEFQFVPDAGAVNAVLEFSHAAALGRRPC